MRTPADFEISEGIRRLVDAQVHDLSSFVKESADLCTKVVKEDEIEYETFNEEHDLTQDQRFIVLARRLLARIACAAEKDARRLAGEGRSLAIRWPVEGDGPVTVPVEDNVLDQVLGQQEHGAEVRGPVRPSGPEVHPLFRPGSTS